MSNAMRTYAAVVGEPASEPHHAAVVGEPPNDMAPVLGEPVLLANGISGDQPPVAAPSPENDPATNGTRDDNATAPESGDSFSSSSALNSENLVAPDERRSEERRPSAPETAVTHGSSPETQGVNAASVWEGIPEDVEVTHILDVPSQPPQSQVPIYNPLSVLYQDPDQSDVKSSEDVEGPAASDVSYEAGDRAVSASVDKEVEAGSGDSASESVSLPPATHEPAVDSKESAATAGGADDKFVDAASEVLSQGKSEPTLPESRTTDRDLDLGTEGTTMDESSTRPGAFSNREGHKDSKDHTAVEGDAKEDESLPGDAASRKAVFPEGISSEKAGQQFIPVEESTRALSSSDKISHDDDGFENSENNISLNQEKSSTETEKSSFPFKLPVILTVVVAVVGVVAISISRSRQ